MPKLQRVRAWLKEPVKPRTRGAVLLAAGLSSLATTVRDQRIRGLQEDIETHKRLIESLERDIERMWRRA